MDPAQNKPSNSNDANENAEVPRPEQARPQQALPVYQYCPANPDALRLISTLNHMHRQADFAGISMEDREELRAEIFRDSLADIRNNNV